MSRVLLTVLSVEQGKGTLDNPLQSLRFKESLLRPSSFHVPLPSVPLPIPLGDPEGSQATYI